MDSPPPPTSSAPPPIILVTDYTSSPIINTHYHNGSNVLSFRPIYASIKSLKTHSPCPHRPTSSHWPCTSCSDAFQTQYWSAMASLLDYFADFHTHDTPLMSSLWFHLLDTWQESRSWFPIETYLSSRLESSTEVADALKEFTYDYCVALGLVDRILRGREEMKRPREDVIHEPSGAMKWFNKRWNTGPFVSGLKPWEQFLCAGSPGVAGFEKFESKAEEKGKGNGEMRYIPQAAIAIMQTHTERARNIATKLVTSEDEDGNTHIDTEFLARFDQHSLVFPSKADGKEFEYRLKDGSTITSYTLINGAPPVERYPGYCDRDMVCEKPTFTLLDECVALCRGVEAYEPVSGSGDGGDDDDDEDDGLVPFDMWAVYQCKDEGKERTLPVLDGREKKDGA